MDDESAVEEVESTDDNIYDDLSKEPDVAELAHAKVAQLEAELAGAHAEIARLKAHNYDLLMMVPRSEEDEPRHEPEEVHEENDTVESLFFEEA